MNATTTAKKRVVVLGASAKAERYSNRAVRQLLAHGHEVVAVNPAQPQLYGLQALPSLAAVSEAVGSGEVDTVSLYLASAQLPAQLAALLALKPRRVIFNPGTEQPEVAAALQAAGIEVIEGCTLVMLAADTF